MNTKFENTPQYAILVDEVKTMVEAKYQPLVDRVAGMVAYTDAVTVDATVTITITDYIPVTDINLVLNFPELNNYDMFSVAKAEIVKMLFQELLNRNKTFTKK